MTDQSFYNFWAWKSVGWREFMMFKNLGRQILRVRICEMFGRVMINWLAGWARPKKRGTIIIFSFSSSSCFSCWSFTLEKLGSKQKKRVGENNDSISSFFLFLSFGSHNSLTSLSKVIPLSWSVSLVGEERKFLIRHIVSRLEIKLESSKHEKKDEQQKQTHFQVVLAFLAAFTGFVSSNECNFKASGSSVLRSKTERERVSRMGVTRSDQLTDLGRSIIIELHSPD